MSTTEVPQFQHDCEACLFLGRYVWEGNPYDLYAHEYAHGTGSDLERTVIARYGDNGEDYTSGIPTARTWLEHGRPDYPLCEALRRRDSLQEKRTNDTD